MKICDQQIASNKVAMVFSIIQSLHGECFFSNRVITPQADKPAGGGQDSWLKDRKKRTAFNIKTMDSNRNKHVLLDEMFGYASVLFNDP